MALTFTAVTTWVSGLVTSTMLNTRVNALITELQNAVTPTAAADVTLLSGATLEVGKAQASQYGNSGLVSGALIFSTTSSFQSIAQLPSGVVPAGQTYGLASGSTAALVELRLSASGLLEARTHTGTPTRIRFALPFQV